MKLHKLKIDPYFFNCIRIGVKTFEIRFNDRNYKNGDKVRFCEKDCVITARIGFITDFEQKEGYVVFSLLDVEVVNGKTNSPLP